ncbi:hypothetical protein FHL15_008639 [Xylaria flabelliformis]|uniref:Zn(2)-C6 fungal-type domain-containing protein n=1 Tax=Xylaria flabelliformis TaxID=2512241 RepID=A0A553HRC4_9PEZI|nr:hypothetical protein FHL15_008639 [Xylaria flabelliformis]
MDRIDVDSDAGLDALSDSDMPGASVDDADLLPPGSSSIAQDIRGQTERRYFSKRPHRKSRAGSKPTCKACTLRKEQCVYPNAPPQTLLPAASHSPSGSTDPLPGRARCLSIESADSDSDIPYLDREMVPVITEPLFMPEQAADVIDMKMLWFYTAYSFQAFSINAGRSHAVDFALKIKIVEHAFRSPFLMETLKALAALHLRSLNQSVPNHKLIEYQAQAFQGYRNAIETANPVDFPALLGCSLFTIAMSSQTFRDPNGKRLFIVDWIAMWRGIGLIIELISPQAVKDSGLAAMFYRPPIDLEKAAQYVPNNLLFMVTSIQHGDVDYDHQKQYYELLKYLGSLYMELIDHGFGPVLDLRIMTLFTFCPRPLLALAKQLRPRMLVILAYWLCFVNMLRSGSWWMQGLTPQIGQIIEEVGDQWEHLMRVPQMVMQTTDTVRMARLIIDNHNWTPGELDLYHKNRDPRTKTDLKLITNEGAEVEIADGHWRFKINGVRWDMPNVIDRDPASDRSGEELLVGSNLVYQVAPKITVSAPSPVASSETASTPALSPSKSPSP